MTADDLFPLILELTLEERTRLVRLLVNRADAHDAARYGVLAPAPDEFGSDDEPLAWEADGWEEFY